MRNVSYWIRSFVVADLWIKAVCLPLRMHIWVTWVVVNLCGLKTKTHWVIFIHGVHARVFGHLMILFMHLACNQWVVGSSTDRRGAISFHFKQFRLLQIHLFTVEMGAVARAGLPFHILIFTNNIYIWYFLFLLYFLMRVFWNMT